MFKTRYTAPTRRAARRMHHSTPTVCGHVLLPVSNRSGSPMLQTSVLPDRCRGTHELVAAERGRHPPVPLGSRRPAHPQWHRQDSGIREGGRRVKGAYR